LDIPKELISSEQLQELRLKQNPSFIPVDQEKKTTKVYDEDTGIVQRRLSNGIPVNYK
ncbi:UNVERIFIED_CONTAM: Stromal processing peptidase, chloroplastic, partial [Sesamum indicum]